MDLSTEFSLSSELASIDQALIHLTALESAQVKLSDLQEDVGGGLSEKDAMVRLSLIKTLVPGSSKPDTGPSLESSKTTSTAEQIKKFIEALVKFIKEAISKIWHYLTGARDTIRLRRTQLEQGHRALETTFKDLVKKQGRLNMKREFIRNSYVIQGLSIEGKLSVDGVFTTFNQMLNIVRDMSQLSQRRLLTNASVIEAASKELPDTKLVSLLTPERRPAACSMAVTDKLKTQLALSSNNYAYRSKELAGNRALIYVGLRDGLRQADLVEFRNKAIPALPWVGNKHGLIFKHLDPEQDLSRLFNMGFSILSEQEMRMMLEYSGEFLRVLHATEADLEALQNKLGRLNREMGRLLRNDEITPDAAFALRSYLKNSTQDSVSVMLSIFNYGLNITQQSLSWVRGSLAVYQRGK